MLIPLLGSVAVIASLPLLWWAVSGASPANGVSKNLGRREWDGMERRAVPRDGSGRAPLVDLRQAVLEHSAQERAVGPAVQRMAERARRLTPGGMMDHLEHRVLLAGVPEAWPIQRVLAAKLILGAGAAVFAGLTFVGSPGVLRLLLSLAGTALAWFLPDILLYNSATKRQLEIQRALPDVLDQMTIAVEAGLAFDGAIARAGKSGEGPLNGELLRTMQDVQAGLSRNEALKGLADRTNVDELRQFVLAVIQADKFGVPVARVLRIQAAELRMKRRQRAEESAMKLPVKIIFPLVLFILPVVFIVLLGPAAIRISHVGLGG